MELLTVLYDLHRQATQERSHHYTGTAVRAAITEIERLRVENKLLRDQAKVAEDIREKAAQYDDLCR